MQLSDFDYELPSELIAQFPLANRSASRLLVIKEHQTPKFIDSYFKDISSLLKKGDLLVFNDTQVIPARVFGSKTTGGRIEILVERVLNEHQVLCQIRASKTPQEDSSLLLGDPHNPVEVKVIGRQAISGKGNNPNDLSPFYVIEFPKNAYETLQRIGELPLPPYIKHAADAEDLKRYQTVYAKHPGAVAAPTAGLHFDEEVIQELIKMGVEIAHVTLHVGSGTFTPVRTENLSEHQMHYEKYSISAATRMAIDHAKAENRRIISVGTTSLRALESSVTMGDHGDTNLFITPGYVFQVVDALITNFHLPKSTLLMLVSAFSQFSSIKEAYQHAIEKKYRFFSYGDAMFLERFNPS
jgi:S-adenosylmethionine:tRNA ribosyltransferase-isomerase